MRPYPEEVLKAIQTGVATHFAPELQSPYAKAQFAFAMLLFTIAQRDYDTAVPDLVEHNRRLRELLGEARHALASIGDGGAKRAIGAIDGLPPQTDSLKLSDLRREREELRGVVCALAPVVEPAAEDEALAPLRDVRSKLLAYLREDSRKRVVPILTV